MYINSWPFHFYVYTLEKFFPCVYKSTSVRMFKAALFVITQMFIDENEK